MGNIVVSEFISLDGVIEAPETWHFPYLSDDMQATINELIHTTDVNLYGRKTYEDFAAFWPTQTNNEFGIADKLNSTPKYVVSSTLDKANWQNTTILRTMTDVARVKQEIDGTIGITGSAALVQSLMQAGLVDEYQLMIHPIVVGSGQRLFTEEASANLQLVASKTFSAGVILLTYRTAQ